MRTVKRNPFLSGACAVLGGMILTTLGIVGEYISRIYEEVKHRPLYVVRERIGL